MGVVSVRGKSKMPTIKKYSYNCAPKPFYEEITYADTAVAGFGI